MTLVLGDQRIASRDCENGVLGAFWMSTCPSTGRKALGKLSGGMFRSPNRCISPCNEKIKPRKSASFGSGCVHLPCGGVRARNSYLVDPASSHMLVSKIKPCMSKYKCYTVKLRMSH